MTEQLFEQQILNLNFSFLEKKDESGVLLTDNYENLETVSPDIIFALETAKMKFNADAVYFRYFNDGRGNVPQLYIFDSTHQNLTAEEKNRIHIQMWNGYQVPAYIIIEKSSVSIFDSRKRPKESKGDYAKELLTYTGESLKQFHAKDFDNGLFWDEQNKKKSFQFEESATRDLIRGLKKVFTDFQKKSGLDRHIALKLLVQSLLIKYLEERDEKSASGYFAGTYFRKHFQCSDFCDTIRNGKLLDLLDKLASDFNGQIFDWDKKEEIAARNSIKKTEVKRLADFLDGNNKDNQYVIWRLYSFSHLPVEVISSVYEELLTDSKDIVYTPEMIVSTLVDECMPLKKPQPNLKIIDVSCGSGIFLVKTYKRIVQWWRYEQWKKTGILVKPSLTVLKELLLKSIHGIDIEQDAIRLSVFSLALAVLDEVDLDPPTWGKLKFPDLSDNIITKDFFEYISQKPKAKYDLVIGNPPFNLPPVNGKEPSRKKYFKELAQHFDYKSEIPIPDENPALHFLVQSMHLLKEDGILSLIQPSGPLLYQQDLRLKEYLFSRYNFLQVIDFTKLADKLWGKRKPATAAVFIQKTEPDYNDILHLVANRTFTNTNRLFLEFDHYDFHWIDNDTILNKPFIWKTNLMGGGRLNQLIERLAKMQTVGSFLENKVKNCNWKYSEGYTVGNKKHYADYIHNKISVTPKNFKEEGIIKKDIENEAYFEAPRKQSKEIYLNPHIIIKENIGQNAIPIELLDYDAVFSHEIIGIYAPEKYYNELESLYNCFVSNNSLYRFYTLATSPRVLIGRATAILKRDIDNLPLHEKLEQIKIDQSEKQIIEEILFLQRNNKLDLFSEIATIETLNDFSSIFCKTLNSIYQHEKSFQLFKVIDAGKYYALHFEYTTEELNAQQEVIAELEKYIEKAIPTQKENQNKGHFQRIIKAYGQDTIILAKPKQLRYWLPSIALRDADETFAEYIKSRYSNA